MTDFSGRNTGVSSPQISVSETAGIRALEQESASWNAGFPWNGRWIVLKCGILKV